MNQNPIFPEHIFEYMTGTLSHKECLKIEQWIHTNNNKELFDDLNNHWNEIHGSIPADIIENQWSELSKIINSDERSSPVYLNHLYKILPYAAVLLISIGIWMAYYWSSNAKITLISSQQPIQECLLPDGSKVWLNAQSSIQYARFYFTSHRYITLTGEAYFEVTRDTNHPFIIKASSIEVKVVGTQFNVTAYPGSEKVKVTVQSGKVEVSVPGSITKVTLGKNEEITYSNEHLIFNMISMRDLSNRDLKYRQLNFNETPMKQVIKTIEEFYDIELEILLPKIEKFNITAVFNNSPSDSVLAKINNKIYFKVPEEGPFIVKKEKYK